MRHTIFAGMLALALLGGCVTTGTYRTDTGSGGYVTVGGFYETMAPYGDWVSVGSYGRAWRPSVAIVGAGFRPYGSGGHWVNTDLGWSFESDYQWGWAAFHYGRWMLDPMYGWVWVPDTVWGPSWVSWRYGGGYIGWAPLGPLGYVSVESYHPAWCFVQDRYFVERDVYHYATPVSSYHQVFAVTAPIHNTIAVGGGGHQAFVGPPVQHVANVVGHPIVPVSITPPQQGVLAPHNLNGQPAIGGFHQPGAISAGGNGVRPGGGVVTPPGTGVAIGPGQSAVRSGQIQPGGVQPGFANRPAPSGQPGYAPQQPMANHPQPGYGVQPGANGRPPAYGTQQYQGQPQAQPYRQPSAQPYGGGGQYQQPAAQPYGGGGQYHQPAAQPSYGGGGQYRQPVSQPSYRAPAPSYSAPSRSFSPMTRPSAPSGGGGRHR